MLRTIAVLTAASTAIGLCVWASRLTLPTSETPPGEAEARAGEDIRPALAQIQQQLWALDARLRAQETERHGQNKASPSPEHGDFDLQPDEVEEALENPEALTESRAETIRRQIDRLDEVMDSEPRDEDWSDDAEQGIGEAMAHVKLKGSELVDARCQTSMCRVEVTHQDADARGVFLHKFDGSLSFETSQSMSPPPEEIEDGQVVSVMYVTRAGYDLPHL